MSEVKPQWPFIMLCLAKSFSNNSHACQAMRLHNTSDLLKANTLDYGSFPNNTPGVCMCPTKPLHLTMYYCKLDGYTVSEITALRHLSTFSKAASDGGYVYSATGGVAVTRAGTHMLALT